MRLKVLDEGASSGGAVGRIDEAVMIPDLLRSAPQVRPVLDRYGLRGCGGRLGPVESLGFFAQAHGVPLDQLLRELREANAQIVNAETGAAFTWRDPCVKLGATIAYNDAAYQAAKADVSAFLVKVLGLH